MLGTRRSLRTEILVGLGFVTSAAVVLVGLTTLLLTGADLGETVWSLVVLWAGSTAVFVVFGASLLHRVVLRPLATLTAEVEDLAQGTPPPVAPDYGSAELNRLARQYRAAAEDLLDAQSHLVRVEKLAGLGRLAAGVAHEVRNPLGAVGTYLEVLDRRGADAAVTREMRQALDRIERIIQGLLEYARPGSTNGKAAIPSAGPVDLNDAVRTVVGFLSAQGMLRDHELEMKLDQGVPAVQGERHALEQVVVNLVANGCQAAPKGRIVIGTMAQRFEGSHGGPRSLDHGYRRLPEERVWSPRPRRRDLPVGTPGALLYVADSGPGVPAGDRERIFDPFFTTKEPGEGTGLGLAIVARTVHESGGVVWVDQAREGGAVFKVFLPLTHEIRCAC